MIFEHALEASALFAMRRALDDYRAARPEADVHARQGALLTTSGKGAA
jgi:hypothetical protein